MTGPIRWIAVALAVAGTAAAEPAAEQPAGIVTVTLVGGGKVTAPLLRQSEEGVVLDLGYEVLQIPA